MSLSGDRRHIYFTVALILLTAIVMCFPRQGLQGPRHEEEDRDRSVVVVMVPAPALPKQRRHPVRRRASDDGDGSGGGGGSSAASTLHLTSVRGTPTRRRTTARPTTAPSAPSPRLLLTESVTDFYNHVDSDDICLDIFSAVQAYREALTRSSDTMTPTTTKLPSSTAAILQQQNSSTFTMTKQNPSVKDQRPLVYRAMHHQQSGFGSNVKGMITMAFVALVVQAPLTLESDCPQLSTFFRSDVAVIPSQVNPSTPAAARHCWHLEPRVWRFGNPEKQLNLTLGDLQEGFPREPVFCDRHLIHFLANTTSIQRVLEPWGGIVGMRPRDISGCLYRSFLQLVEKEQVYVKEAMDPWNEARLTRQSMGLSVPHFIVIQIRTGGDPKKWSDPRRIESMEAFLPCLNRTLLDIFSILMALEQSPPPSAPSTSSVSTQGKKISRSRRMVEKVPPSFFAFVSTDEESTYHRVKSAVPPGRLIEFDPTVFAHTARSHREERNDRKVIIDFSLLEHGSMHIVSRSGFGEMAAWIGATRRRRFPEVPQALHKYFGGSTLLNIFGHCNVTGNEDCANRMC